jgi:hypothetical protein
VVGGLALLPAAVAGYVGSWMSYSLLPPWGITNPWELGIKTGAGFYVLLLGLAVPCALIEHRWKRTA